VTTTRKKPEIEPVWAVTHTLRIRGTADTDAVVESTMLDLDTLTTTLQQLGERDLVIRREGRVPGWKLTDAGKAEHARLLAHEMTDPVMHAAVHDLHETFAPLNPTFKEACTAWQLRDGALNTHDDPSHDEPIVRTLRVIHTEIVAAIDLAASRVATFRAYAPRLRSAIDRLEAGDIDAFTRPLSGSYHDVWMELHHDLITRLELERGSNDA
jgi:hypothetical protein